MFTTPAFAKPYALALVAPWLTLGLCLALRHWLGVPPPLLIFLIAVIGAAWWGGLGPGLLATSLGVVLSHWFLITPLGGAEGSGQAQALALLAFAGEGAAISFLGHALAMARAAGKPLPQAVWIADSPDAAARLRSALEPFTRACAWAVLAGGLIVLLGWAFHISAIQSLRADWASMKPVTALCFILAGAALAWRRYPAFKNACAAAILVLAGMALAQDLGDVNWGIDYFWAQAISLVEAPQSAGYGRMSGLTALNFALLGCALLLLNSQRRGARQLLEALALLAGGLGLLVMIGYLYEVQALFRVSGYGSMAIHSALMFMVLVVGLLCARSDGVASLLAQPSVGGQVARRFVPLALVVPVFLGWLTLTAHTAGWLDGRLDNAILVVLMVVAGAALARHNAKKLAQSDAQRSAAERQVREHEVLLATLTAHAHIGMVMLTRDGRYAFANAAYSEMVGLPSGDLAGQRLQDVLQPNYESRVRPHLERVWAGQLDAYVFPRPERAPGEGPRFIQVRFEPPVDTLHGPCVIGLFVDVTQSRKAEQALRASQERLQVAAAAAKLGIWEFDVVSGALIWDDAMFALYGAKREDFAEPYHAWFSCLHPQEREALNAQLQSAAERDTPFAPEFRVVWPNAQVRHLKAHSQLMRDAAGKPLRLVGTQVDITQRKRREAHLAFLAQLQQDLAGASSSAQVLQVAGQGIAQHLELDHCWLTQIDLTAQQATSLYDAHAAQTPHLPEAFELNQLLSAAALQALSAGQTLVFQDVLAQWSGSDSAETLAEGLTRNLAHLGVGAMVIAPYVSAGRWRFTLNALRGQAHAWEPDEVQLLTDLSARVYAHLERARADEAMRASEADFRGYFETVGVGTTQLDSDGHFKRVNQTFCDITGYTAQELQAGMGPGDLDHPADGDMALERQLRLSQEFVSVYEAEKRYLRKDGRTVWVRVTAKPVFDPQGRRLYTAGVVVDITERKLAEQALRERESGERARLAELEALMMALPAAVFITHTPDCAHITGNPTALAMMRLAPGADGISDDQSQHFEVWSEGRLMPRQELPLQRAAASGQAVRNVELDFVYPDGETLSLFGSALPLFDEAGAVRGAVSAYIDISDHKRRERNLVFLGEMQQLFTTTSAQADLMRLAAQRMAQHMGARHCLLVEIDENENQAKMLYAHPERANLVGAYALAEFRSEAERHDMAAGKTLVINDVQLDIRTPQERQRFEQRGIRSLVSAPYVADGHWRWVLSVARGEAGAWRREDVDLVTEMAARLFPRLERARTEEALRQSEERLRLAAQAARFGMYDRDLGGAFFHVSEQLKAMLGYGPDETVGHAQVMAHMDPADAPAGIAAYQRACAPGGDGRINVEQRIIQRSGAVRWIQTVGQLLFKDGVPVRSVGFWVDITERKEAQAVLERRAEELRVTAQLALASQHKSEFLANMSHELRTPLNSMLILSRLLADNRDGNLSAKQVEFAEIVHQSGTDLLSLINEILDLSKIEAGQMQVGIDATDLTELAQRVERDFVQLAHTKALAFRVEQDPALAQTSIQTDGKRLHQVLRNLLANAFKFTEQGEVVLRMAPATTGWPHPHPTLDRAAGVIAFAVSDTGIGIAADKQLLIFEAFAQADGTTTRKYGGTGLGLSISREIASLLGGAIELHSQPGQGSCFTLYLPLSYTPKLNPKERAAPPSERPLINSHPLRALPPDDRQSLGVGESALLVVENDANFARLLLDIAHRHGLKVLLADTARAALALARNHEPAAITLSVTLPDMDGWRLVDHIRDDLAIRHIPVHIVSGEDERPRGLRRGAASYLQKPATEADLDSLFERIKAGQARAQSLLLLVVEDDPAMQQQILAAIGTADDVNVSLADDAEGALAAIQARRYDCVVLDLRLPGMTGFEFLEQVRDRLHADDLPVVVYTAMDLSPEQQARLSRLAESVLLKDARSFDQLLDQTSYYLHRRTAQLPAPARRALERLHSTTGSLAGLRVLLVDDDMRNVYALLAILEAEGIEVQHAENGQRCLDELTAAAPFNCVLLDMMMPVMDGYETLRHLRAHADWQHLPVIALTAKAMTGDREKCLQAGASDFLAKPIVARELLAMIGRWARPAQPEIGESK